MRGSAGSLAADLILVDATSGNLAPVTDLAAALVNRATAADIRAVFHNGQLAHGSPLAAITTDA